MMTLPGCEQTGLMQKMMNLSLPHVEALKSSVPSSVPLVSQRFLLHFINYKLMCHMKSKFGLRANGSGDKVHRPLISGLVVQSPLNVCV